MTHLYQFALIILCCLIPGLPAYAQGITLSGSSTSANPTASSHEGTRYTSNHTFWIAASWARPCYTSRGGQETCGELLSDVQIHPPGRLVNASSGSATLFVKGPDGDRQRLILRGAGNIWLREDGRQIQILSAGGVKLHYVHSGGSEDTIQIILNTIAAISYGTRYKIQLSPKGGQIISVHRGDVGVGLRWGSQDSLLVKSGKGVKVEPEDRALPRRSDLPSVQALLKENKSFSKPLEPEGTRGVTHSGFDHCARLNTALVNSDPIQGWESYAAIQRPVECERQLPYHLFLLWQVASAEGRSDIAQFAQDELRHRYRRSQWIDVLENLALDMGSQ